MGNSPLVRYTKLSPNCTKPRNKPIDTITIHCMAGNLSVETCGNVFAPPERQASSNYGIGSDGRVALYVDEANRSWCTSSSANDNRAVTIEVANSGGAPDWPVSEKAMASLLDLVTDICQRNGIKQLVWRPDKNNPGNMTVHRWYANKACPGDYLYNRHGDIAAEVNRRLAAAAPQPQTPAESVDKRIWDYLKGRGLPDCAVAGIMGNLYAESGLVPGNLQNTFEKKLGMTDAEYTAAVDGGRYTNFVRDGAGYGLAQWTYWSRKQALLDFAKAAGASIGNLEMQLAFLWDEMCKSYAGLVARLKVAASVKEASNAVLLDYERPADQSAAAQEKRAQFAQTFHDKFAVQTGPALPYLVRITADVLNIRKGPGTTHSITGQIKDRGVYTIVEETAGWGRLKSGAGWISLAYCQKLKTA